MTNARYRRPTYTPKPRNVDETRLEPTYSSIRPSGTAPELMAVALDVLGGALVDDVPTLRTGFRSQIGKLPSAERDLVTAFVDACMVASEHAKEWPFLEDAGAARTKLLDLVEQELDASSSQLEILQIAMSAQLSDSPRVRPLIRTLRERTHRHAEPFEPPYTPPPVRMASAVTFREGPVMAVVALYWLFCSMFLVGSALVWRAGLPSTGVP